MKFFRLSVFIMAGIILLPSLTVSAASLISNGDFNAAPWNYHAAPAAWKCVSGNHRILASGNGADLMLGLQKPWAGSTVPVVWQRFKIPPGAAILRLDLRVATANGAQALLRLRTAGANAEPEKAAYYNGSTWKQNRKKWDYSYPPAGVNPYTRGDIQSISAEHSFAFSAAKPTDFIRKIPVPAGTKDLQLELGIGGRETGDNNNAGALFYTVAVTALDAAGKELTTASTGGGSNVDAILAKAPPSKAEFAAVGDARMLFIDGKPCTMLGWSSIVNHNVSDRDLRAMLKESGFPLARLAVPLGNSIPKIDYGAQSWPAPDIYDWSYLDSQLARIVAANPNIKVIINLIFDSPQWWSRIYPRSTTGNGRADYLSKEWEREGRKALRRMLAHIQDSPYAGTVIGYTLFNGESLDCNWNPDIFTPAALAHFREFLRRRYADDAALRKAWKDRTVTLVAATPSLDYTGKGEKYPLIFIPEQHRRVADSMEFSDWAQNRFMHQFAAWIKEATRGRRVVGFRSGNLLYGAWGPEIGGYGHGQWGSDRHCELLDDPNVDYLEQWDSYPGRGLGDWGTFAPINPVRGMFLKGKAMVLQDDVRTHVGQDKGFGATANLKETLSKQKAVFLNAMTQGMNPYLWQMSYTFAIPELMFLWRRLQDIWTRSIRLPRRSVAEIAVVADPDMQRFIGRDLKYRGPTRGFALIDYGRFHWARSGAAYDMIFLDQVPKSNYRVYIFYHTFKLDEARMKAVHATLAANKAVAFFVWCDGIIDGKEKFSVANAAKFAGIKLETSPADLSWRMRPEPALIAAGFNREHALGVDIQEPYDPADFAARLYPPTLVVNDPAAIPLGRSLDDPQKVTLAEKLQPGGWTAIYSQSPILAPGLLRYALRKAGAFQYLTSDDGLFVSSDFIGVHTRSKTKRITLRLPKTGALYELFHGWELSPATEFTVKVEPKETYWFFRGSKAEWEALAR
jgi:hypothetical protein